MAKTVLAVSGYFKEGHHRYRRRQDDESAGSRKQPARKQVAGPTRKTGVSTAHKEAVSDACSATTDSRPMWPDLGTE